MGNLDGGGIEGVQVRALKVIEDDRGAVLHMLREDQEHFTRFGEVYFSEVRPGVVKGWKRHRLQTQNLAVPAGTVRFVLHDGRPGSATRDAVMTVELGRQVNYALLSIPPGVWYAFRAVSEGPSLVANCADIPHHPLEGETCPLDDHSRPSPP